MIEIAKALNYNQNFILWGLSSTARAVYMYKIMILLKSFSGTTWPIFAKFHVNPTIETGRWVYWNGLAPLIVMHIYGKK